MFHIGENYIEINAKIETKQNKTMSLASREWLKKCFPIMFL